MKSSQILEDSFLKYFSTIKDPRINNFNKRHFLIDIITITLCAVICKCETWEEITDYGEMKKDWFKKFLKLPNGIPSHDTFRRVFMLISPKEFNKAFISWTDSIRKKVEKEIIPFDGKAIRGSASFNSKAIHMVSAWSTENGIVLGQTKVDSKTNEIKAIPELIDLLDIRDTIITIDAIGCQTEIAKKIVDKRADYVLALKNNHKGFFQRVESAFDHGFECDFENINFSYHQENNISHGRTEERNYYKINDIAFLNRSKEWKGLAAIGLMESIIIRNKKLTTEKRYYITSLKGNAAEMGNAIRKHWNIENNLHWKLDVQFRDDDSRKREKNSAANFSAIKRIALNLLKMGQKSGK